MHESFHAFFFKCAIGGPRVELKETNHLTRHVAYVLMLYSSAWIMPYGRELWLSLGKPPFLFRDKDSGTNIFYVSPIVVKIP